METVNCITLETVLSLTSVNGRNAFLCWRYQIALCGLQNSCAKIPNTLVGGFLYLSIPQADYSSQIHARINQQIKPVLLLDIVSCTWKPLAAHELPKMQCLAVLFGYFGYMIKIIPKALENSALWQDRFLSKYSVSWISKNRKRREFFPVWIFSVNPPCLSFKYSYFCIMGFKMNLWAKIILRVFLAAVIIRNYRTSYLEAIKYIYISLVVPLI